MSQRISLAQTELQLAMSNPQMHNLYMCYRKMYEAIGVKDIDRILPPLHRINQKIQRSNTLMQWV